MPFYEGLVKQLAGAFRSSDDFLKVRANGPLLIPHQKQNARTIWPRRIVLQITGPY